MRALLLSLPAAGLLACAASRSTGPLVAHLAHAEGNAPGFERLRSAFARANPGYDVAWSPGATEVDAERRARVVLVQGGAAQGVLVWREDGPLSSPRDTSDLEIGAVVLLRPGEHLSAPAPLDVLVFDLPATPPGDLPTFIRPDWDPLLTDTPGGCATEGDAYRRILLTWLAEKGPYVWHALNAHRVRIHDSFTHYHPVDGGFDEFYLVQEAPSGARLLTSTRVPCIEAPAGVTRDEAHALLEELPLRAGDLVYLPRGVAHRGLGAALVQVITVPGFRPGAEIGLDHHLRAIVERLGLVGAEALPFNEAASRAPVVR